MTTPDPAPRDAARAGGLAAAEAMVAAGGGQLPTLGMVIRDVERLLAQATDILYRDVDPASEPTVLAWPAVSDEVMVHTLLMYDVWHSIERAKDKLARIAALPLPPAGSAVKFPAAAPVASGESPGGPPALGAPSPDPSPSGAPAVPGRGVGPGLLGRVRDHGFDVLPALLLFALATGPVRLFIECQFVGG